MDSGLDAEELLHLAMKAMEAGDHEHTIGYLKRGVAAAPDDGRLHYLLGAIHAELGMHERAIAELTRATELAPQLETAHFQLGLMHAARADVDRAEAAWRPLDALGADHPLQRFRDGVLHLGYEEYEACVVALRDGIARNHEYPALNDDMGRLLNQAEAALAASAGAGAGAGAGPRVSDPSTRERPAPVDDGQHVLLNRYRARGDDGR